MTDHPRLMMFAVLLVTFIAGYAVISFVVKKLKEGPFNPALTNQSRNTSETDQAASNLKSDAVDGSQSQGED